MSISLYDLSVANYLQGLDAVSVFLGKGHDFCTSNPTDPNEMIEFRLFADMLPFHSQIAFVVHHSLGAVEGLKNGVFTPPALNEAFDYPGLQKLVADAASALRRLDRQEVDALEGRDVIFQVGERKIPFTAENFILSFSLPNFYFHAATAYDILRTKGVPLGKRHYLGQLRIER
jgi:hypothetical protein